MDEENDENKRSPLFANLLFSNGSFELILFVMSE